MVWIELLHEDLGFTGIGPHGEAGMPLQLHACFNAFYITRTAAFKTYLHVIHYVALTELYHELDREDGGVVLVLDASVGCWCA